MPDRLQEIRARLDAWKRQTDAMEAWEKLPKADRPKYGYHVAAACGCGDQRCGTSDEWYPVWYHEGEVYEHAPADIAWLLRRLDFETRLVADLEAQLDRAHERYAAEVERLRNTKASPPNPLRDGGDDA